MKKFWDPRRSIKAYIFILTLFFGVSVVALCFPRSTWAANVSSSHVVTITASVNGPPPDKPAVIETPNNNDTFSGLPISVTGSCMAQNLIIKIVDNHKFIGSAICSGYGKFSLSVDLFKGRNVLIAQEFDSLGQQGPDSKSVKVYYNPLTTISSVNPSGNGTKPTTPSTSKLNIDLGRNFNSYTGCSPGQQVIMPITVSGGTGPYAVSVNWGDGIEQLISLKNSHEPLLASHAFDKAGAYEVSIKVSDHNGQQAFLNVGVIVNGPHETILASVAKSVRDAWHSPVTYAVGGLLIFAIGFIGGLKLSKPRLKLKK